MAVFADPEGAVFSIWQAGKHRGARVVNEAGSLNFNGLHTRDPEAAKEFYGAVFGWRTMTLDGGQEMWTMPGYGDHLESLTPGLRDRMLSMGAQPGFEDVVASLLPLSEEHGDVPPHWDVTFAADDAEAIAARATELGGSVIMPPTDVPWARMTMIRDPQGATFNANQFVPENKDIGSRAGASAS
jgi:predicted enzyme related to lactoylglutathione lyase